MRPSLPFLAGAAGAAGAVLLLTSAVPAVADDEGFTIKDPRITESSGLAASRLHPGVYWTHNDSDDGAFLYAVDSRTGETVATITLTGVGRPRDVEAISIGPGNQLYVGDIGDNLGGSWDFVWIYRLPEPKQLKDRTIRATQYVVKYEDGPRDAEALMVHPKTGRVYIADKKEEGGSLYEGPAELSPSGTNVFKRVAAIDIQATDGAFSPDGAQLAVRAYFGGTAYAWNNGKIKEQGRLSVPSLGQGESLTYTTDGSELMFGNEGANSTVEPGGFPAASGGSNSASNDGGSAAGEAGESGDGSSVDYKLGALVLALGLTVVLGFKRLLRRG
ncbi:WD40 repeat domain-containing protein [Streptomyces cavernae]|uniref:WD40 repeat domain-containing protein n=1 Tax=Streptomyces cavernae TaxID=2259034 RepID=UPI000FEBA787|nr:WD40 repeat domain-containing protein [Streptomyces cavernae]